MQLVGGKVDLVDIVQEQGSSIQLRKQPLLAGVAQQLVRPSHIQLRAVDLRHGLATPGRAKVDQRCQLILLQARLPKDVDRLPAQKSGTYEFYCRKTCQQPVLTRAGNAWQSQRVSALPACPSPS